jgi:hypothetical protein
MATNYCTSTGELAATTQVTSSPGALSQLSAIGDGTNASDIYAIDSNDGGVTGIILAHIAIKAGSTYDSSRINVPVIYNKGLVLKITGTGGKGILHFIPE